jgi:WD40 repeat protein
MLRGVMNKALQGDRRAISRMFKLPLSPDDKRVVTASFDTTARLWDVTCDTVGGEDLREPGVRLEARRCGARV